MGHTGEALAFTPIQNIVAPEARDKRTRRTPIVTVQDTVVRIVLPEGFGESDWKRLKEEAQQEEGEEEEIQDSEDDEHHAEVMSRGYERSNHFYEGKDEFGEEEDDEQEEAEVDSDREDNDNEDESDDDEDAENNQQEFLGKRMTARQLSMAKRAERTDFSQVEESTENFDQLVE